MIPESFLNPGDISLVQAAKFADDPVLVDSIHLLGLDHGLVLRVRLVKQQGPVIDGQFPQDLPHILAVADEAVQGLQGGGDVPRADGPDQGAHVLLPDGAAGEAHHVGRHRVGHDAALFQQAQGVAHAAFGSRRNQAQGLVVGLDAALVGDHAQMGRDFVQRDGMEVKALAPRMNRGQHLFRFRRRQDEHDVFRRLFQGLQQSVPGIGREHVGFVDDVDFVAAAGRGKVDALVQVLDVFHAAVRRRVHLQDVEGTALGNGPAVFADAAGVSRRPVLTVQGLREDAGRRRLARAAGAGKQVGVADAPRRQGVHQGLLDRFLPDDLLERVRAPPQI